MSTNPFSNDQPSGLPVYDRVGFGPRFGAFLIDVLASIVFALILSVLLMQFNVGQTKEFVETIQSLRSMYDMFGISTDVLDVMQNWLGAWVLSTIIANISYSLIEGLTGASPGKRILHIYIARSDGSHASLSTLLNRWVVKNVGAITSFIALVPALSLINTIGTFLAFAVFVGLFFVFSQNRQTLHDLIAQTAVFRK